MVKYHYRAIDAQGKIVHGTIPTAEGGEAAAVSKLQAKGLIPLRIQKEPFEAPAGRPSAGGRKKVSVSLGAWRGSRLTSRDLISIAEDISVLLEAGISLARGLAVLMDLHAHRKHVAGVLRGIHDDLREGVMFWEAMARHPQFPPVFVNMVRAGETGGALPTILGRLASYLEEVHELRSFLLGAMIYPAILTLTSLFSMVLMLTLVVPKFAGIFQDMGVEIPTMTLVMFKTGAFLQAHWWHMALAAVLVAAGLTAALRSPRGRSFRDRFVLGLPVLGSYMQKIEIARFCRTLGTLLESGVPILEAMQTVRGVVSNSIVNAAVGQAHLALKRGELLSASLEKTGRFPSLAVSMIGVGEETGRLGQMLDKVGRLYDRELRKGIKTFSSFFEPVVLLVMGTLIGGMVISMLMAIFSINDMNM
jgi:general secretion pathway protein F